MQETVLELKNYSVSFDTPDGEVQAVRNVDLTVKKGEINLENMLGSSLHVRQILQNITSNAVKFNKPNGKVILECR